MSTITFDELIGVLFTAGRKPIDETSIRIYEVGVGDIPLPLLEAAVKRAIRTRTFLPSIAELREDAEACRVELIRRNPLVYCEACREQHGWLTVQVDGVDRLARCQCVHAWRAKVAQLGVTTEPVFIALPSAAGGGEA